MHCLDLKIADNYTSLSQKIRVMSERWVGLNAFCPNCGENLISTSNNSPVADFKCKDCTEDFELKSKKGKFGKKVVDGAYQTMMERLSSDNNPNLFLLSYDLKKLSVSNLLIIPKFLFVPKIIEKRKPLSMQAKRAGWTGCNILINDLPESGKIYYLKDGVQQNKIEVQEKWRKIIFLNENKDSSLKGWLLDVMKCIDLLETSEFKLEDIYAFEQALQLKHPENSHVKDKIRQQLQYLRDKGYIEFVSRGRYHII